MTDRIDSLTVVLENEMREDDIQALVDAIKQFKNVASVGLNIVDINTYISTQRARHEIINKLWHALD